MGRVSLDCKYATAGPRPPEVRRDATSEKFLDEADYLMGKLRQLAIVFAFGGKENKYNQTTLPEPLAADVRNYMPAARSHSTSTSPPTSRTRRTTPTTSSA
ncbi:hypothetical protein [Pseudonocardia sediminis]|uniref:hypothetical protein n=1 Tax=Pseudonocardia sediminis TaxID=1397368 RepID=UPI00102A5860|nr:hypothetical protein [Pseudonocardia sediminis]